MTEVRPVQNGPGTIRVSDFLDRQVYAIKKTIGQGMLDIALLTANASQLKYLLHVGQRHDFYYLLLTLISISIIFQLSAGVIMTVKSRFNINKERNHRRADILNDILTWMIFVITILNIFISSFGVEIPQVPVNSARK